SKNNLLSFEALASSDFIILSHFSQAVKNFFISFFNPMCPAPPVSVQGVPCGCRISQRLVL
ncbi:hypothetical protein, partial [Mitsuokella jalaludinii]|uniref:hypothetical protein n=1 Tax=Mitsuokella jalaludinii TaxID=187979 RepID=UPI003F94724A